MSLEVFVSRPSLQLFYEYLGNKCAVYLVFEAVVKLRQLM